MGQFGKRRDSEMANISRKLAAMALSAALIGTMGIATMSATAADQSESNIAACMAKPIPFTDVNSSTPHANDTKWMYCNGISTGFKEGNTYTYRGMNNVIRQDMAAFLRRIAVSQGIGGARDWKPSSSDWNKFRDVKRSTPHVEDILWLAQSGVSTGWRESNGTYTFRPEEPVKRQDMAAFLYRLAKLGGVDVDNGKSMNFSDVNGSTPHVKEIRWLGGSGISTGWRNPNGTYRYQGMSNTVRQDMSAFLHRTSETIEESKGGDDVPNPPAASDFSFTMTYEYDANKRFSYKLTDVWVDYVDQHDWKRDKPQLHLVFQITNSGTTTDRPFIVGLKAFQNRVQTDFEYISFSNEIQPGGVVNDHEVVLELSNADSSVYLTVDGQSYYGYIGSTDMDLNVKDLLIKNDR